MKLIVGLGNPGEERKNTRHNIGFIILDEYLKHNNWKKEPLALVYKERKGNEEILFVKPTTYMNLSGSAVKKYIDYYKINIKDILIIQDDLDLELGKIKIKANSSSGGHNGIKDIINQLKTNEFKRLKIGISHPKNNTIDYVISNFKKEELEIIKEKLPIINNIIDDFINNTTLEELQNKYN